VLVNTGSPESASTGSCGDFSQLEVAEKLCPFLLGRLTVFVGGPKRSATREESEVRLDCLVWIDGLVSEGDIDVPMSGDDLRDVRFPPNGGQVFKQLSLRLSGTAHNKQD
jgi:hypothetical protein